MANLTQIESYLKRQKLPYKLIDLGGEIYRVEDVIRAGVIPDEIVKILVVRSKPQLESVVKGSKGVINQQNIQRSLNKTLFYALAIRGRDRLDFKKVRRLFGPKSELAKAGEVQRVVGVPVGAVCPILVGIPLYFDRKVLGLKNVNLGSGDLTKGLEMKLADLLKAVREYEVEDLT